MKNKRKQEMFPLVIEEATQLKLSATADELKDLSFDQLDPLNPGRCIYGLMTGDCFSSRAKKLIKKCAKRVYKSDDSVPLRNLQLNGKPNGKRDIQWSDYFSPIEVFIAQRDNKKNIKRLIDFLKGKTDTLTLK